MTDACRIAKALEVADLSIEGRGAAATSSTIAAAHAAARKRLMPRA